jgi:adenine-specific DNA-methyltransferase
MATTAHEISRRSLANLRGHDNDGLVNRVDALRLALGNSADDKHRSNLGQFLTPAPIAHFMASLFEPRGATSLRLLDAGAGIGTLSAAWVAAVCAWEQPPCDITVTAFEIDAALLEYLQGCAPAMRACM